MQNLGVFFPESISVQELVSLGIGLGGEAIDQATLRVGEIPEAAYIDLATHVMGNGAFDEEELAKLTEALGFLPAAYVSIHFSSNKSAFDRALRIAKQMQGQWGGKIDYSGAGGSIENPFLPPVSER